MRSSDDVIRVGIIRCNIHGDWFSYLFDEPNQEFLRKADPGCHYYFYRWDDPQKRRVEVVPGFQITKIFDESSKTLAEKLTEGFDVPVEVCGSFQEVSDDVDLVYIADCDLDGTDHLRYATPGLKKGVPHLIGKPFANTLEDARAIIDLAKENSTAVMCSSLLRQSPYLARFGDRFADIAPVSSVVIQGRGTTLSDVFDGVSTAQNIMGEGCEWVESMGENMFDIIRLHYPGPSGGIEVVIFNAVGGKQEYPDYPSEFSHSDYRVSAYGRGGIISSPRVDNYTQPEAGTIIVNMAKQMAQTNQPQVPYDSMLELMEIIEAARAAHNKGIRVSVNDIREGKAALA